MTLRSIGSPGAADRGVPEDVLRTRTSQKWRCHPADVLPSFIAEMDLPVADEVLAALATHLDRGGDLGYAHSFLPGGPAPDALCDWLAARFGWRVDPVDVLTYADVMRVVEASIDTLTAPGDAVLTDVPCYPGFPAAVVERGRELVYSPMRSLDGCRRVALDRIGRAFADGVRMYLLCSPHNPTGRVHTARELNRILELAAEYDVTIVSDEVHAPLVYRGSRHVPIAALPAAAGVRVVTALAASKAWNVAGLKCAFAVPGDPDTAERLLYAGPSRLRDGASILGLTAARAAYRDGGAWLTDTVAHLDGNRNLLARLLSTQLPEVRFQVPQSTYLGWLDCRTVADRLGDGLLADRVLAGGRLAVSDGAEFGCPGFLRLNFATSRALVVETVRRLAVGLDASPEAAALLAA